MAIPTPTRLHDWGMAAGLCNWVPCFAVACMRVGSDSAAAARPNAQWVEGAGFLRAAAVESAGFDASLYQWWDWRNEEVNHAMAHHALRSAKRLNGTMKRYADPNDPEIAVFMKELLAKEIGDRRARRVAESGAAEQAARQAMIQARLSRAARHD